MITEGNEKEAAEIVIRVARTLLPRLPLLRLRPLLALLPLLALTVFAAGCAAGPGPGEAPVSEDARITEEVQRIIADRDDIVAGDIEVEVRDGVVVLSGVQTELEPVSELLRRVARVRGVTEVVNRIRIIRLTPTRSWRPAR